MLLDSYVIDIPPEFVLNISAIRKDGNKQTPNESFPPIPLSSPHPPHPPFYPLPPSQDSRKESFECRRMLSSSAALCMGKVAAAAVVVAAAADSEDAVAVGLVESAEDASD